MPGLCVNGEQRQFSPEAFPGTLIHLVEMLDLKSGSFVAEVNGEIVPRDRYSDHALHDGDTIEFVSFIGGG